MCVSQVGRRDIENINVKYMSRKGGGALFGVSGLFITTCLAASNITWVVVVHWSTWAGVMLQASVNSHVRLVDPLPTTVWGNLRQDVRCYLDVLSCVWRAV